MYSTEENKREGESGAGGGGSELEWEEKEMRGGRREEKQEIQGRSKRKK